IVLIMRFSIALCLAAVSCLSAQVKYSDDGNITIDGKPFTTFHKGEDVAKPYLAPVRSASGKIVTRGFPMEKIAGESTDHLHHTGLWFSYDDVNGTKLWENHPTYTKEHMGSEVVTDVRWNVPSLAATIEWRDTAGQVLLVENREMKFGGDAKVRMI